MDLTTKQKQRTFKVGEKVKVIREKSGLKNSRIGMVGEVSQKGWGASYWIKFQGEPEMVFRSAWIDHV